MCAIILVFLVATAVSARLQVGEKILDDNWELFKIKHEKVYDDLKSEEIRRLIWEENRAYYSKHNHEAVLGQHTFEMGENQFSDLTNAEYRDHIKCYTYSGKQAEGVLIEKTNDITLPDSVDWRNQGKVTDVKNQGQCGACWTFAVTGALEGQHAISTGSLVSLSEQNLVDCDKYCGGCNGGNNELGFRYIIENGGIDTESSYPYEAKNDQCRYSSSNIGATAKIIKVVPKGDEGTMQFAVATIGPIAIGFDAGHPSFQSYRSGVYSEPACSTTQLDHAMLIAGYGNDNGQDYWLIKNSWASGWGENGYLRVARNKGNMCGVATDGSVPGV